MAYGETGPRMDTCHRSHGLWNLRDNGHLVSQVTPRGQTIIIVQYLVTCHEKQIYVGIIYLIRKEPRGGGSTGAEKEILTSNLFFRSRHPLGFDGRNSRHEG